MPQIYDNITLQLCEGLAGVLNHAEACSFCVGYLNLRGWDQLGDFADALPGGKEENACRLLVGMQRPPEEDMKALARLKRESTLIDGPTFVRLKTKIVGSFKQQLEFGVPSNQAEQTLRRLAEQIRKRQVYVKAFLRYPLHAKLYLVRRKDGVTPLIGFVGSSNLTLAGLVNQGELNVDVVEQDAALKLQAWFDDRWNDTMAIDLSDQLAELIENSWARTELVRPFLIYLKIAYHLCEEARQGEREFRLPRIFKEKGTPLLDFQEKAVSLAAHRLYRRGGVLLGDVVGLGKTIMATAVARILQEDDQSNTLIITPPKLKPMWEHYLQSYEINGKVLSIGKAADFLGEQDAPRYRLVIIDESHTLRNREGKRYRAIRDYIERNDCRVMLLTATPYNKLFSDLSNQLRLFLREDQDMRVRPERYFRDWYEEGKNEADFISQYQTLPSSLRAFEQSGYAEDWRDLMRLFLVRRTRQFIIRHYAQFDEKKKRHYVTVNGSPAYLPVREPKRLSFEVREDDPADQYARLFSDKVLQVIEGLILPRYGLAEFLVNDAEQSAKNDEKRILENLNRAGRRLIGFCRTNLFKRLESEGFSFLQSVRRHILRNLVTLHALETGKPVPIGTQDIGMFDAGLNDADEEFVDETEKENSLARCDEVPNQDNIDAFKRQAERVYQTFAGPYHNRFDWLPAEFFRSDLADSLRKDAEALLGIINWAGTWKPEKDAKLAALIRLLTEQHPREKVLVFTQFSDTADYLGRQLEKQGLADFEVVTGNTADPFSIARRFSPSANGGLQKDETELRVLIATDVLAEGQNLQDAHIVVNFDLPWAIIRLIQRAGRVDRIGQKHDTITVYSFLPADGVERIIQLRRRLFTRLQQNQEVVGTDESFFGEASAEKLRDLYTEKAGTLDDDADDEDIDLASQALQVWNSASKKDQEEAKALPPITAAARALSNADGRNNPPGVIAYLRYPDGTDALVRVDENGMLVSQSLSGIFRAAACSPDEPPLPRNENHHALVARCIEIAAEEQSTLGGRLGTMRSVRRKLYERLDLMRRQMPKKPTAGNDPSLPSLEELLDLIWRYPLKRAAQEAVSRQMRLGITDGALLELLQRRAADGNLCEMTQEPPEVEEPQLICSMGLVDLTQLESCHEPNHSKD